MDWPHKHDITFFVAISQKELTKEYKPVQTLICLLKCEATTIWNGFQATIFDAEALES